MSKNGPLDFEATIDAKMFNSMLDEMERRIRGVSGTVVKEGAEMDKTFRNIGAGMAAYFSAQQLGDFVTQVANVRGEFQQLEISFETMLMVFHKQILAACKASGRFWLMDGVKPLTKWNPCFRISLTQQIKPII